jgi:TetR/AcrR family transcriptional regulator, regulator of biofilm formation and stress response
VTCNTAQAWFRAAEQDKRCQTRGTRLSPVLPLEPVSKSKSIVPRLRRFDPHRRARIAEVALEVVSKWGVEGLTHRRVAALAEVPLGSTTYHFSSSEDLLAVAIELAVARNTEFWHRWAENLPSPPDLAEELATLLVDVFSSRERHRTIVQLELYLAAMRRPALRPASVTWGKVVFNTLAQHTDASTARALSFMLDSLAIESLVAGEPPSRDESLAMFRRVLIGPGCKRAPRPASAGPR